MSNLVRRTETSASVFPGTGLLATMMLTSGALGSAGDVAARTAIAPMVVVNSNASSLGLSELVGLSLQTRPSFLSADEANARTWGSISPAEAALHEEVDSYAELSQNWDGYGGNSPSEHVIASLRSFLAILPTGIDIPKVTLASSGLPSLYWDSENFFADLEFGGDAEVSLFARAKSTGSQAFFEFGNVNDAAREISRLLRTETI